MVKYVVLDENETSPWLNVSREPVEAIRADVLHPAAAEMLEALELAKEYLTYQLEWGDDSRAEVALVKISKAISKAKGKTEE